MIENEITNLFALVGSIKANAERVQGAEKADSLIEGITEMCDIANDKLSVIQSEVKENV